jgi:hypothetical protein
VVSVWSLLIVVAALALVDLAVARFGSDSRDGRDWRPECRP